MLKYVLGTIFIFLCLFSCQNSTKTAGNDTSTSIKDSISLWLSEARQNRSSIKYRDSILKKAVYAINNIKSDSVRLSKLSALALVCLDLEDSLQFRKIHNEALELSHILNDSLTTASLYWDLGSFFNRNFIKDSAYYTFGRAEKIYGNLGMVNESSSMFFNLAVNQKDINDLTGSEINSIKAIEGFLPLNNYVQLFYCYNLLGSTVKTLKEFDLSQRHFVKAQEYLDKIELKTSKQELQNILDNNIGNAYKEEGAYRKGIPYFERVLKSDSLFEQFPIDFARTLDNLTYSRFKSGENEDIVLMFEKALKIHDSLNNLEEASVTNYHLSEYYINLRDTVKANVYANRSLNLSKQTKAYNQTLATLKLLTDIKPDKASEFLEEYLVLNDSLLEEERKIRNKFTRIRFETDAFIAENRVLSRQKQLWFGIAMGLILLALSIYIIIYQRAKNQKLLFLKQQQEANQEVFNLMMSQNQKVEESKKNEQRRISEELHDGVLGQMNGIRMVLLGLNNKSDPSAVNLREDAITKLQSVQEELRSISHELNNSSNQKFNNFIISLEEMVKESCDPESLSYKMEYNKDLDWDALNGDVKINLYRIIQELLYNTIKYASATAVELELDGSVDQLNITYKDNGIGFDKRKVKKGIGHKNISSRMKRLNGSWDIVSKSQNGTTVNIILPYYLKSSHSN
ncbi:MAG: ATP-binding protein [Eudoraea sp.]